MVQSYVDKVIKDNIMTLYRPWEKRIKEAAENDDWFKVPYNPKLDQLARSEDTTGTLVSDGRILYDLDSVRIRDQKKRSSLNNLEWRKELIYSRPNRRKSSFNLVVESLTNGFIMKLLEKGSHEWDTFDIIKYGVGHPGPLTVRELMQWLRMLKKQRKKHYCTIESVGDYFYNHWHKHICCRCRCYFLANFKRNLAFCEDDIYSSHFCFVGGYLFCSEECAKDKSLQHYYIEVEGLAVTLEEQDEED